MNKKLLIPLWIWKIMRLSFHQLVLCVILCGASYAHETSGQAVLEKRVSLDVQGARFKKVLSMLGEQAGVRFIYSSNSIDSQRKVTMKAVNQRLDLVLKELLSPHSIDFSVSDGKMISLTPVLSAKEGSITVPEFAIEKLAREVRGRVVDEKGEALPGVSILLKGTQQGLISDADGKFSIEVPDEKAVLVFSFVGYISEEVPVSNKTSVDIILRADEKALEEVIVVGYGTQRKASVTGSVSQVEGKDLINVPVANISSTLAGRLPGVVAIQRSGQPGSDNTSINIRGFGGALVIVDGVEQDYNQLDPREIETISILKDASAAIFGARAGNGVILVTTKRGAVGKPKIDFSFSNGFQSNTRFPDLVDAGQYARALNDARRNAGNPIPFTDFQMKAYDYVSGRQNVTFTEPEQRQFEAERQNFANTDWVKTVFKPVASIQQYNINSRGGGEKINYFLSLGYLNQQSVLRSGDNKFSRVNFRSNLDATISEDLTVSLDLGGRIENRGYPGYGMSDIWNGVFNDIPIKILGPDPVYPTGLGQATADASVSGTQKSTTKDFNGALSINYIPSFIKGFQVKAR